MRSSGEAVEGEVQLEYVTPGSPEKPRPRPEVYGDQPVHDGERQVAHGRDAVRLDPGVGL